MKNKRAQRSPYRGLMATLMVLAATLTTSEFWRHWSLARTQGQLVAAHSNIR